MPMRYNWSMFTGLYAWLAGTCALLLLILHYIDVSDESTNYQLKQDIAALSTQVAELKATPTP